MHRLLRERLGEIHDELLGQPDSVGSVDELVQHRTSLGPVSVSCVLADGDGGVAEVFGKAYHGFPAHAGKSREVREPRHSRSIRPLILAESTGVRLSPQARTRAPRRASAPSPR